VATPLTFGNLLKCGLGSYHNTKDRPTSLHREREYLKLRVNNTHTTIREGPSNRAPCTWELSPQWLVKRRLVMAAMVFPLPFPIRVERRHNVSLSIRK